MSKTDKKLILIAIDPFESELFPTEAALKAFRGWLSNENAIVEGLYVLNQSGESESFDSWTIAKSALNEALEKMKLPVPVQSKVLIERFSSKRKSVSTFIDHARKESADLIVLTSHGRNPVGRVLLGGFAESILADSPAPVLFINSVLERKGNESKRKGVLFPTDFSPASRRAFDLFLEQFKTSKPDIILLHVGSRISLNEFLEITHYIPESYWAMKEKSKREEAARWMNHAEAQDYQVRYISHHSESTPEAIITVAIREEVDLIAMASTSGKYSTRILGSVASEVFFKRLFPVWVCGPEAIKYQFSLMEGESLKPVRGKGDSDEWVSG